MSLFETEVSDYSRNYISGMNALEAHRESIVLLEQVGNMLRDANIPNHAHCCVHSHYSPARLHMWINVYGRDCLKDTVMLLHSYVSTQYGKLAAFPSDNNDGRGLTVEIEGHHPFDVHFESKDVTSDGVKFILDEVQP